MANSTTGSFNMNFPAYVTAKVIGIFHVTHFLILCWDFQLFPVCIAYSGREHSVLIQFIDKLFVSNYGITETVLPNSEFRGKERFLGREML
jgi:hypothetical protein